MHVLYLLLYLIFISFLGTSKRFGELRSLTLSSSGLWRFASNGPQRRGRVPAGRLCPPGTGPARRNADLDARLGLFPCGPVGGVKVLFYWSCELHQMKGLPQNPSKSLQIYLMVCELVWKKEEEEVLKCGNQYYQSHVLVCSRSPLPYFFTFGELHHLLSRKHSQNCCCLLLSLGFGKDSVHKCHTI